MPLTGAERKARMMRVLSLFGEIEATARRGRQNAEIYAKYPTRFVNVNAFTAELSAMAQTMAEIAKVLRDIGNDDDGEN